MKPKADRKKVNSRVTADNCFVRYSLYAEAHRAAKSIASDKMPSDRDYVLRDLQKKKQYWGAKWEIARTCMQSYDRLYALLEERGGDLNDITARLWPIMRQYPQASKVFRDATHALLRRMRANKCVEIAGFAGNMALWKRI